MSRSLLRLAPQLPSSTNPLLPALPAAGARRRAPGGGGLNGSPAPSQRPSAGRAADWRVAAVPPPRRHPWPWAGRARRGPARCVRGGSGVRLCQRAALGPLRRRCLSLQARPGRRGLAGSGVRPRSCGLRLGEEPSSAPCAGSIPKALSERVFLSPTGAVFWKADGSSEANRREETVRLESRPLPEAERAVSPWEHRAVVPGALRRLCVCGRAAEGGTAAFRSLCEQAGRG